MLRCVLFCCLKSSESSGDTYGGLQISASGGFTPPPTESLRQAILQHYDVEQEDWEGLGKEEDSDKEDEQTSKQEDLMAKKEIVEETSYSGLQMSSGGGSVQHSSERSHSVMERSQEEDKTSFVTYGTLQVSSSGGFVRPTQKKEADTVPKKKEETSKENGGGGSYGGLQISSSGGFLPPKKKEQSESATRKSERTEKEDSETYGSLQISSSGGFSPPKKNEQTEKAAKMKEVPKKDDDDGGSGTYGSLQISSSGGFLPPKKNQQTEKAAKTKEVPEKDGGTYGVLQMSSSGGFLPPKKNEQTEKVTIEVTKKSGLVPPKKKEKAETTTKNKNIPVKENDGGSFGNFGSLQISSSGGFVRPQKIEPTEKALEKETTKKVAKNEENGGTYGDLHISISGGFMPPKKKDEKPVHSKNSTQPVDTGSALTMAGGAERVDTYITQITLESREKGKGVQMPAFGTSKPSQSSNENGKKTDRKLADANSLPIHEASPTYDVDDSREVVKSYDVLDEQMAATTSVRSMSSVFEVEGQKDKVPTTKPTVTRSSSVSRKSTAAAAAGPVKALPQATSEIRPPTDSSKTTSTNGVNDKIPADVIKSSLESEEPVKATESVRKMSSMFEQSSQDSEPDALHKTSLKTTTTTTTSSNYIYKKANVAASDSTDRQRQQKQKPATRPDSSPPSSPPPEGVMFPRKGSLKSLNQMWRSMQDPGQPGSDGSDGSLRRQTSGDGGKVCGGVMVACI